MTTPNAAERPTSPFFPHYYSNSTPPIRPEHSTFTSIIAEVADLPGHNQIKARIEDIVKNLKKTDYAAYLANTRLDLSTIETFLRRINIPTSTHAVFNGIAHLNLNLNNAWEELSTLESSLHKIDLHIPSLSSLYRSKALINDLLNLESNEQSKLFDHYTYFVSRSNRPHLLVGHYAVHVLGLLADGKHIAKRIDELWKDKAITHFYQFEGDTEQLRTQFKRELDAYAATLSDAEINELQTDLRNIWPMVGDLLGIKV